MSIYECMALEIFKMSCAQVGLCYALAVSFHFDGRPYYSCNFVTCNNAVLAGLPAWHDITLRNITPRSIT